jgi:DNA-binding NarL/FixJ family response regulator
MGGGTDVSVVICDHRPLLAESLSLVLGDSGFQVAAVTSRPSDAVRAVAQHGATLCLMDLDFSASGEDPIAAVQVLREQAPAVAVVLLTARHDLGAESRGAAAGATGLARMDEDVTAAVETLRRVLDGQVVLDSHHRRSTVPPRPRQATHDERLLNLLTPREREALVLLRRGTTTPGIATCMGVTYSTARSHIQSVLEKLGVHSRLEAAVFASAQSGSELVSPRA